VVIGGVGGGVVLQWIIGDKMTFEVQNNLIFINK